MAKREFVVTVPVRGFEYHTVMARSKADAMRKVDAGEDCRLLDMRITSWAKPAVARPLDVPEVDRG